MLNLEFQNMRTIYFLCVILLLISCNRTNNRKGKVPVSSAEISGHIINPDFGGVGFHVYAHAHKGSQLHYEQVFAKRWREFNPSFVRLNDYPEWDFKKLDTISKYLEVMKETNTEMYFTSWLTSSIRKFPSEEAYVRHEVDNLEYLKRRLGFKNIRYYCMANELTLDHWASMVNDLEYFKKIHGLFYKEIETRNLDIGLLATDASPFENWHTIEWAADNMDDITAVYGGHHYINNYDLFDVSFYNFFLNKMKWGVDIAGKRNKKFIVGEYGPKQNVYILDSVINNSNIYNNTPLERYVGIQLGEAILAMINAGVYAACYWTFSDFPSIWNYDSKNYTIKWGTFRREVDNDYQTRPHYYAMGLLTKFFRGPAEVYKVNTSDTLLRVCAIKNLENGSMSVAVINRNEETRMLRLMINNQKESKSFRKYLYDPEKVPFNYFGDLQQHEKKINLRKGLLTDTIPPQSLIVYTTNYDDDPPAMVKGMQVDFRKLENLDRAVLTWEPNTEKDFCYYRIYRSEKPSVPISARTQIASTISNKYVDRTVHNLPRYYYRVTAVDQSGNSSE